MRMVGNGVRRGGRYIDSKTLRAPEPKGEGALAGAAQTMTTAIEIDAAVAPRARRAVERMTAL